MQTLEFDEFHSQLKSFGLSVGANIVSEFLDDKVNIDAIGYLNRCVTKHEMSAFPAFQCIPYTMRNLRQDKAWTKKKSMKKTGETGKGSRKKAA